MTLVISYVRYPDFDCVSFIGISTSLRAYMMC